MPENRFYDHYTDFSSESGFEFEFYCERCGEGWRSAFQRHNPGRLPEALDAASRSILRRRPGGPGVAAFRGAAWDRARDAAFRRAAHQASEQFHHCPACHVCCCPRCWNRRASACLACAPRSEEIVGALAAAGDSVSSLAPAARPGALPAAAPLGRPCPVCRLEADRGAFCPHCGVSLGKKTTCRACRASIPDAARFCPQCGVRR
jgi:hypothetical protein